jgi:arylsulfatase A-like enzyme
VTVRHPPDLEHLVALYDGEIAYVDEQIGELLKSLGTSWEPAKTLIVVAGDHGEAFGEHGKMHHANSPHEEEVRVPMIWCWQGVLPKAYRVQTPVSTLDIAATLREATGAGKDQVTQGMSLWPALKGGSLPDNRQIVAEKASSIVSGLSELAIREGKWRMHARPTSASQPSPLLCSLYDLEKDPKEQKPIPLSEEPASASMEEGIDRFLSRSAQLRDYFGAGKEEGVAREERIELLRSLGYFSGKNAP